MFRSPLLQLRQCLFINNIISLFFIVFNLSLFVALGHFLDFAFVLILLALICMPCCCHLGIIYSRILFLLSYYHHPPGVNIINKLKLESFSFIFKEKLKFIALSSLYKKEFYCYCHYNILSGKHWRWLNGPKLSAVYYIILALIVQNETFRILLYKHKCNSNQPLSISEHYNI